MIHNLTLERYRGFESFEVHDLKRVNLLVGLNNSGKSSILEALDFLVSEGDPTVLVQSIRRRGENSFSELEALPDVSHLFYGHPRPSPGNSLRISANDDAKSLTAEIVSLEEFSRQSSSLEFYEGSYLRDVDDAPGFAFGFRVTGGSPPKLPDIPISEDGAAFLPSSLKFRRRLHKPRQQDYLSLFLTPSSLFPSSMNDMWDKAIADRREPEVVEAMKILNSDIESIHFLSGPVSKVTSNGILLGFRDSGPRLPIGSFGDGMLRLLALSLALVRAERGCLMIDEIDTGLHYSVMQKMWRLVVSTAQKSNIQVFATTHSFDCINGLASLVEAEPELASEISIQKIESSLTRAVNLDGEKNSVGSATEHRSPLMVDSERRSRLYVEGNNDRHAIIHLLIRHGIDYDSKPWPPSFPLIESIGGKDELLDGIETAVRFSNNLSVGFVLDANSSLQNRWSEIRSRLEQVAVQVPDQVPDEGFVGDSNVHQARVGVWLMPDNQHDGNLEDFLQTLIAEGDQLHSHAHASTEKAMELGASFSDGNKSKAIVRTWLAWQKEPGLPYGTAIRARFFDGDSPAADCFVAWFREVFKISCP